MLKFVKNLNKAECLTLNELKILFKNLGLESEVQGAIALPEFIDQLVKEFPSLARGDDGGMTCSLPKPCSHFSCHIRSWERSGGVDGDRTGQDRTGVGALCWMPLLRWCFSLGHHFPAGQQMYSSGKVDGRVDYGLAGSSSRSCSTKEEGAALDSELDRLFISAQDVGIISIITKKFEELNIYYSM